MMANLEIRLLGGLQVRQHGAVVTGFMSSKVPALLAYLAVTGRPHQRDALAGLLRGEMPDDAAANNLRQALSNLRKVAEPHFLITRETVAFNREIPTFLDVEAFRAAACYPSRANARRTSRPASAGDGLVWRRLPRWLLRSQCPRL